MSFTLLIVLVAAGWGVVTYNGLVARRLRSDNAWKQIGVQLSRRHDLIPNLVETVKGAMEFERETLERVMSARARAVSAQERATSPSTAGETIAAENALSGAVGRLFALMENYPQLKANENILRLQEELSTTENQIGFARQHYNDAVTDYNTHQQSFPGNLIAGFFAFQPAELFTAPESDKAVPKVDLSLRRE
jgi:LemA protein